MNKFDKQIQKLKLKVFSILTIEEIDELKESLDDVGMRTSVVYGDKLEVLISLLFHAEYSHVLEAKLSAEKEKSRVLLEAAKLGLSFAPKGPVPKGLAPMFFNTLDYDEECELQNRIDEARRAIEKYHGK